MTFIRNEYGLWCPNCQERIDEMWPDSCDACGYPSPDCDDFDADRDEDDYPGGPNDLGRLDFIPATIGQQDGGK